MAHLVDLRELESCLSHSEAKEIALDEFENLDPMPEAAAPPAS